jgi:hypothetical protein
MKIVRLVAAFGALAFLFAIFRVGGKAAVGPKEDGGKRSRPDWPPSAERAGIAALAPDGASKRDAAGSEGGRPRAEALADPGSVVRRKRARRPTMRRLWLEEVLKLWLEAVAA